MSWRRSRTNLKNNTLCLYCPLSAASNNNNDYFNSTTSGTKTNFSNLSTHCPYPQPTPYFVSVNSNSLFFSSKLHPPPPPPKKHQEDSPKNTNTTNITPHSHRVLQK